MSQFRPPSLPATLAWSWLALLGAVALLAPWLPLPYAPTTPDLSHLATAPTWQGPAPHYLGTDPLGRDMLAGLVAGAHRLLLLTLPATALATATGALLGGAAGYWGNHHLRTPWWALLPPLAVIWLVLRLPWWLGTGAVLALAALAARRRWQLALPLDSTVLTLTALLGAVPRLVLALVLGTALSDAWLLSLLALLAWPDAARLVRSQMLRVQAEPYVEAARALGLPPLRVWWRHALPAACRPLRTLAPLLLAALVSLESTLAFLGVSATGDTVSWGELLGQLRQEPMAWWLLAGPGTALAATLLALRQLAQQFRK